MAKKEHRVSLPAGIGLGIGMSISLSILGCMLTAWLMEGEKIGQNGETVAGYLCTAVACLAGCYMAVASVGARRMQVSVLTGVGYYLSLLAITALFFEGQFAGLLIPALIVAAAAILVGFLTAKTKNGSNIKRQKRPFR